MYYVYFIRSRQDNSIYVGYTNNLKKRIKEHNQGKTKSIKHKLPFELIYFEAYINKTVARKREIKFKKSWSEKETVLKRLANIETAPSSSG